MYKKNSKKVKKKINSKKDCFLIFCYNDKIKIS